MQVPSCQFWDIFKSTFFYSTPPVAASAANHRSSRPQIICKQAVMKNSAKLITYVMMPDSFSFYYRCSGKPFLIYMPNIRR